MIDKYLKENTNESEIINNKNEIEIQNKNNIQSKINNNLLNKDENED